MLWMRWIEQRSKGAPARLRRLHEEGGQATILVCLSMVVLVMFLGLSVDIGRLRMERRNLQTLADATAMAAGLEIRVCGNLPNCPAMQAAVQSTLTENGYASGTVITNCAAASGTAVTVTLNSPPCAMGAADPNAGNAAFVETVVTEQVGTYFARIAGFNNIRLTVRSEASRPLTSPCIYALDPNGPGAISILVGIGVTSRCGVVDESTSSAALACVVGAFFSSPSVNVTGGVGSLLCGFSTPVRTHVATPVPADPLAYLPAPAVGACGGKVGNEYYGSSSAVNILLSGNYVFHPGVYCGGISMTAAILANVTFQPGTYVLTNGPGPLGITTGGLNLTLSLLSSIQGTGVTFYNTGTVGGINITAPAAIGLSNFNLTAPTSGLYGGVLFFQDPGNTTTGTFIANLVQGGKLEGAIYLPTATAVYGVGAISSAYTILVAKDIFFGVNIASTFGNDYSTLSAGSPLNGNQAILVQ